MTNKVFANAAIKFIVGFAIFCAVWGAFFLISIRLFPEHINIVASILAIGTPISYIPFFIFATGTTVESNQKAVPVNVIRNELEAINSYDTPIVVEKENNNKYVLTWRYKDSKWHGFMSKSGMTHTYQLIVKLNEAKKQATVINVYRKILWRREATRFMIRGGSFRGLSTRSDKNNGLGIRESFEGTTKQDLKFKNSEIHDPIVNSLLANGWDVRFALY